MRIDFPSPGTSVRVNDDFAYRLKLFEGEVGDTLDVPFTLWIVPGLGYFFRAADDRL